MPTVEGEPLLSGNIIDLPVRMNGPSTSSASQNSALRLLTLNCWGLKYIADHRSERIRAIASEISKSDYDIVTLQELWVYSDFELVKSWVSKRLPYAKFFYSAALGSGLAIFSRFRIIETSIHPYSLNGSPIDVAGGDWFVGKAAASVVIQHPVLNETQIFNTHLYARGGEEGPEHRRAHRLVNAWELAKLVRDASSMGRYVIAAGDFNNVPATLPMTLVRDYGGLVDCWAEANGGMSPPSRDFRPEEAIHLFGVTADSPLNSYSAGKPLDPYARRHLGKRLDYIFYKYPKNATTEHPQLQCRDCHVAFTDLVPGCNFSYSDHFGLEATISITHSTEASNIPSNPLGEISEETLTLVSQALTARYRMANSRSRFELITFVFCILFIIAEAVGLVWLPHSWAIPIFIIVTVFVSWLGTTMLYSGFIFGNWERRALLSAIEEIELTRSLARGFDDHQQVRDQEHFLE